MDVAQRSAALKRRTSRLEGRRARLVDVNPDLIGCYRAVRDETAAVIAALGALEQEHRARGSDCYYDVRDRRFNPARLGRGPRRARLRGGVPARVPRSGPAGATAYTPELAAMFIYLNRTGFNGLFRLNRQGAFNVPAGRYTTLGSVMTGTFAPWPALSPLRA